MTGIGAAVAVITLQAYRGRLAAGVRYRGVGVGNRRSRNCSRPAVAKSYRRGVVVRAQRYRVPGAGDHDDRSPARKHRWNCIPRRCVRICVWNSPDGTGIPPPIMVEKIRSQAAGQRPGAHRMIVP